MDSEDGSKTLRTTATSIAILEHLEETGGARVSEIAERMDAPKSTVHGHLATLQNEQFVIQRGDSYYLGPELLRLGHRVRTREEGYVLAREYTERLAEEVGLRAVFAAEMDGRAVFLHSASVDKRGWAHERPGNRLYLHDTAVGKAILAALPDPRVEQIVDEWGLPAETENTITDPAELFEELETVRERGYAVNRGENFEELYGIGVAATDQSGQVLGGFSVTGPEHSLTGADRKAQLADEAAEVVDEFELELALG